MPAAIDRSIRSRRAAPAAALAAALLLAGCADAVGPDDDTGIDEPRLSCAAGTVTVDGDTVPFAPGGFFTAGNQILSAESCEPVRFVGVSHPALAFNADGGRLGNADSAAVDFARIREWGANTVRLELAQHFWVPGARFYDPRYEVRVERAVRAARAAGLRVILVLHLSDRGDPGYPADALTTNMHQPMADANHSIPFWRSVAAKFKDDGGILFELYSEPYPIGGENGFSNWDIWLNGGLHPADDVYEPRAAFQAAGMQQLYQAVRDAGAHNLVIASGTYWGYDLSGVPDHRVQGYNVVYATHPWEAADRQPGDWEDDWVFLTRTDPVMITEFGGYDCQERYPSAVLDKADELGISWIAWAWISPSATSSKEQNGPGDSICEFPMLLTGWEGTPSRVGALVKARLASY